MRPDSIFLSSTNSTLTAGGRVRTLQCWSGAFVTVSAVSKSQFVSARQPRWQVKVLRKRGRLQNRKLQPAFSVLVCCPDAVFDESLERATNPKRRISREGNIG